MEYFEFPLAIPALATVYVVVIRLLLVFVKPAARLSKPSPEPKSSFSDLQSVEGNKSF